MDWRQTRELLTPTEMAAVDANAIAGGTPGFALMERAGAAVAQEAVRLVLPACRAKPRIGILCGPGNNGGDGYVAARLLAGRGLSVRLFALGEPSRLKGDALMAAKAWTGSVEPLADFDPAGLDLVVDALFGAGLARDLDGEALACIHRVNDWRASGGRVLAVDVPSGLDGANGRIRGGAIAADATVTFFRLKPGHLLLPGKALCGELRLAHIGLSEKHLTLLALATFLNGPSLWRACLPRPHPLGHKYHRGHVLVLSGPAFRTGAARLVAQSGARSGAGLVTIAGTRAALAEHAAQVTAIMLAPCEGPSDLIRILADRRMNCVVAGPGLGLDASAQALLEAAIAPANGRAAVLDADALTLAAADPEGLRARIAAFGGPVILTPHEGEFSRFHRYLKRRPESLSQAPESICEDAGDKLVRARRLAEALGAIVLLKGPDSIVAAPDGRASIASDLPPCLATAGSGDVLAGLIGGLLAQGMPAFEAASAAVWFHGAAARLAGGSLTADDLPSALGVAFENFWKNHP